MILLIGDRNKAHLDEADGDSGGVHNATQLLADAVDKLVGGAHNQHTRVPGNFLRSSRWFLPPL